MRDSSSPLSNLPLCQVGFVVCDVEATAHRFASLLGAPLPDILLTDPLEQAHTTYRGSPTEARAKLAFFQLGQVSIELIEPLGGPSTWQEHLDTRGEGVHHIALSVPDTGQALQFLEGRGIDVVQQGQYSGGMYTYTNSFDQLGVILELLENFSSEERKTK